MSQLQRFRPQLQSLDLAPIVFITQLDARLDQAYVEMGSRTDINVDAFNTIVSKMQRVKAELQAVPAASPVPAHLERETAEVLAAFDYFAENNAAPGEGGGFSWLWILGGVAAIGAVVYFTRQTQTDMVNEAMSEVSDCGCGE